MKSTRKALLSALVVLALACLAGAPASAAKFYGHVTAIDLDGKTITINPKGVPHTVKVTDQTVIDLRVKVEPKDLPADVNIHFFGELSDDKSEMTVDRVIGPPPRITLPDEIGKKRVVGKATMEEESLFIKTKGKKIRANLKPGAQMWITEKAELKDLQKGNFLEVSGTADEKEVTAKRIIRLPRPD